MDKVLLIIRESRAARFLIPGGLILFVCGLIFLNAVNQSKDYIKTESTVTKVELEQEAYTDSNGDRTEASYFVYVKYTVDGKEYEAELGGMSELKEGQKLTIYYNPSDPTRVTQTKSPLVPIILIAAGIAALAGGIISGINAVKKYKKMKDQEKEWANG